MKKYFYLVLGLFAFLLMSNSGCEERSNTSDNVLQAQTETSAQEAARQLGMPNIVNFQEKKMLKLVYELCDQENLVCYAYLFNAYNGKLVFIGKCIGYGIPYSTQYSNPEKVARGVGDFGQYAHDIVLPQAEPNQLFKPVGLSATWLMLLDAKGDPHPVYIEPEILVSPFPLTIQ